MPLTWWWRMLHSWENKIAPHDHLFLNAHESQQMNKYVIILSDLAIPKIGQTKSKFNLKPCVSLSQYYKFRLMLLL